uniref:Cleavage and polyadenylation-specific factor 3-like protein n=1 Tax=Scophthalmus maximus TaxID=52904 RepID=A0A8D3CN96_SCOMX
MAHCVCVCFKLPHDFTFPLQGAGQDVGRSCILVSIGGKNIMLDCGMHMGYNDDIIIVTFFFLVHSLPYMSEMVGYDGPIYMTHPTKAICPILLEDFRKITVDKKGETNFFTSQMIKDCMKKVVPLNLHQTVQVDDELEIKAYYAGHVLGAAMVQIKVGSESVVYTGDYNMTPDRHLGAAWIDKCRPDILISESTYATTIRDSKRCRERDFLKKVHESIERGGKGEDEPEGPDLLLHRANGESESLLQALHHVDQPEDSENLCPEEHV